MTRTTLFRILIILAGVMGADGVMLAAAAAHQPDATRLASELDDAGVCRTTRIATGPVHGARLVVSPSI